MLRIILPPNLASAAPRDAIAVQVELDLSASPPGGIVPGLAVLQKFGVPPQPVSLVQLKRAQLRELVQALVGEGVFFRHDRPREPLAWNGIDLPGASEHLREPVAKAPVASAAAASGEKKRNMALLGKGSAAEKERKNEVMTAMTVDGSEHYLAITLPSRDSVLYEPALDFLKTNRFVLDPLTRKWWLRDRHKVLNILANHGEELRERYRAEFTPNFEKNTAHLQSAEINAEVVEQGDAFEVAVGLQAGSASEAQVREAVAAGRSYIEAGGKIFLVDATRLERLATANRALAGDPAAPLAAHRRHRVARARAGEVQALLEELAPNFQAPETWRVRGDALRNLTKLPPAPIPREFCGELRPYQQLGVAWMWHLYRQELGGILADEMGLGKTPQALALLASATHARRAVARALPHLAAVPASLMENWRRETARFAPSLRVFVHHGARRLSIGDFSEYDLVLTSYGTLARDAEMFAAAEFDLIVADEAQHLKNRRTQAAQSLRMLRGCGRFLLTGTPLENSLDDLRSLFEFLMPGFLPRLPPGLKREERSWYDERLRAQTAPYILRRTKAAVAPELPPKIEQTLYCEPAPAQAALYRQLQQQNEQELYRLAATGASEIQLRFATLTQLLRLRQVCCDPRLVQPAVTDSAKLDAFRELLAESVDEGHRMLVFSQFTSLLALLREELDAQEVAYCYLDGSMSPKARQGEVDRFQGDDAIPVFLISLKAGGTGLNLTGADVVVHYDPWWNPAAEAQASDRAHRIGQTKVVTTYKLICSGTVEEKVLALQETKRALLADVFEASDVAAAKLSLADLRQLLN